MYAAQKKSSDHDQSVHTLPTRSSGIGDPSVHKGLQALRRPASANSEPSPLTHCTV